MKKSVDWLEVCLRKAEHLYSKAEAAAQRIDTHHENQYRASLQNDAVRLAKSPAFSGQTDLEVDVTVHVARGLDGFIEKRIYQMQRDGHVVANVVISRGCVLDDLPLALRQAVRGGRVAVAGPIPCLSRYEALTNDEQRR
jgi:hypothetical protein